MSMYDESMIRPLREELTRHGLRELKSAADVDAAVKTQGTLLLAVNSVCGCAGGAMRPGVALALQGAVKPDQLATVFAGQDAEATARAREHFKPYPPSSPAIALLKDGKVVHMLERKDIEGRMPQDVAASLKAAFERHCAKRAAPQTT
jgi:putative YphP/YqiW family bacilliredoxin